MSSIPERGTWRNVRTDRIVPNVRMYGWQDLCIRLFFLNRQFRGMAHKVRHTRPHARRLSAIRRNAGSALPKKTARCRPGTEKTLPSLLNQTHGARHQLTEFNSFLPRMRIRFVHYAFVCRALHCFRPLPDVKTSYCCYVPAIALRSGQYRLWRY